VPNNIRLPHPPIVFTPDWGNQLTRALEQNLMATADAMTNGFLTNDTLGRVTTQAVLPFAGTFTYFPATMGLNAKITQAGAQTITLDGTGLAVGAFVTLLLVQDATGGRVTTWGGANIKWSGGVAFVPTTTANKQNIVTWYWDGFFMNEYVTKGNL
jgi:hypothetical protein